MFIGIQDMLEQNEYNFKYQWPPFEVVFFHIMYINFFKKIILKVNTTLFSFMANSHKHGTEDLFECFKKMLTKGCSIMTNETIIEELNTLLRGTYMGIRSFEHYIQKVDDHELKDTFQSMQQELKLNAQKIAVQIQNLNGIPADGEGMSGSMHSFMHKIILPKNSEKIIEDAIEGLSNYGVHYAEELVKGDLDPNSKQIAKEVIDTNRRFVKTLKNLQH